MNKCESFLQTSIADPDAFSFALIRAARELRMAETGVSVGDLALFGDVSAENELNGSSLRRAQSAFKSGYEFDIPAHLGQVVEGWEKKGTATLMRGTRLPDPGGSFEFAGVHVTPQIDIASGYAGGAANSSTGIGRLLNSREIGFLNAYEVPLCEKTYKNFQFEDSLKDPAQASKTTLHDLVNSMKSLSKRDSTEFYLDGNDKASEAMQQWSELADNKHHYEMILGEEQKPNATYLRHKGGLIKVDIENPKWDAVLARVQEASLRDFYEIKPLEMALQNLESVAWRSEGLLDQENILQEVTAWIEEEKDVRANAPWEAMSMKDIALSGSAYLDKRPYISQGERVGSAMDNSRVVKPESIKKLEQIVDCLRVDNFGEAKQLMGVFKAGATISAAGIGQESTDRDLAKLIEDNSQCMLTAIPRDSLGAADAFDMLHDDLALLGQIKGGDKRFDAVVAIGRNAESQVNYKTELTRQNKELASVAVDAFSLCQQEELDAGGPVRSGNISGQIMSVDGGIVTQKVNREGKTEMHDLRALSGPVEVGQVVDIKYVGGVGQVGGQGVEKGVGR